MSVTLDGKSRTKLEDELMELDGVIHATVDPRTSELWVVRDPATERAPVEIAIRNRITSLGHDAAGMAIRITLPAEAGPRRRVRFVAAERTEELGSVSIAVTLEWGDELHTARASGDKGPALELKTAAQAAVNAIEKLAGQELNVRVIGVKAIHAFDTELMVVSLFHAGGSRTHLVGAVVVPGDTAAAAAIAVLNALNRTLGNFLHTSD